MKYSYFLHLIKTVPLLPLVYFQGKRIKREIPMLPEAKNPDGEVMGSFNRTVNILFVGESSFAGVGSEVHERSFAGYFAREISSLYNAGVCWKVYAKSGYNVEKIHNRIVPKIANQTCDLLVVGIGGNDTFELNSPSRWRNDVQLLISKLQDKFPGTPILFAQLPTIETFPAFTPVIKYVLGGRKNLLSEQLRRVVLKNRKVYFPSEKINVKEWLTKLGPEQDVTAFFSDGIHPSELTYELWAKDCAQFLKKTEPELF